jgi:hypothetical protein
METKCNRIGDTQIIVKRSEEIYTAQITTRQTTGRRDLESGQGLGG